jgi:pimeloyl-ACP methyl ester carboxylesterase
MLQHRFFANRGFQCITPDMPGHGLVEGLRRSQQWRPWPIGMHNSCKRSASPKPFWSVTPWAV